MEILKIFFLWALFIPVAILNGIFRESFYAPKIGDFWAHIIATILLSVFFIAFVLILYKKSVLNLDYSPVRVGLIWLFLTVAFEFIFGHYVAGHSWEVLLNDYNIFAGRVWVMFLLVVSCGPLIILKIIKKNNLKF